MSDSQDASGEVRLRHLVEVYCNGIATSDEFTELEQRLRRDMAARGFYLRYMSLESALLDYGDSAAGAWQREASVPEPARRSAFPRRLLAIAVACALVAAPLIAWQWRGDGGRARRLPIIGVLEQLSGPVTLAGSDGDMRSARNGAQVTAGDTVRTQEPQSAATLVYPDGTRLSLVGKTSVTCNNGRQKTVTVHGGTLFASVPAQPSGSPMRIATLTDNLEILGTRLTLDATTGATDLSVKEGRVRLTRLRDGRSVEVPAGRRVVSNAQSELTLEGIPPTPDEWLVDFEDGLPADWSSGKLVVAEPPASGARTAVQAVAVASKQGAPFEIATAEQWTYGLFSVHDDSHLHVTFKMQNPDWFNILILTKTADADPPLFAGNYIFDEPGWWPHEPGAWRTVTIPLKKFRPLPPSQASFENAIPIQVLFSSPEEDRGLVIDRIWVTRGGPGNVVVKAVDGGERK